jgi:MoxR-like ATPase
MILSIEPLSPQPPPTPQPLPTMTPETNDTAPLETDELQAVARLQRAYTDMKAELGKVIVGQETVIDELLITLFCRGHALLVGVPGLAKTLLISTLARTLGLSFSRIQFTPDLMPSDISGTEVIEEDKATGQRNLRFVRGPVFANVLLADEINRTPPKTQAALLEAMQEHQVTAGGKQHRLPQPFFVLATQNPIEQEGTYPLPEAQLDRFLFNIHVGYPSEDEEFRIVRLTTAGKKVDLKHVLSGDEVLQLQDTVRKVPVADHVIRYALQFARLTRRGGDESALPDFVRQFVSWGAGPRASQSLILAGKARALLKGRTHVSTEDVRAVAIPVLRHRIVCNFTAEAEGIKPDDIVRRLIESIPRQQYDSLDATTAKVMGG